MGAIEHDSTCMQNEQYELHLTSKRLNMAKTHQPALFYIWPNDIDECRFVRFLHVESYVHVASFRPFTNAAFEGGNLHV